MINILNSIAKWENSKSEFKLKINNIDSIAAEIVSFLNAEWGIILFGIEDNWKIVWIDDIKKLEEQISNISRNNIFPEVILDFEIQKIENKDIFILKISMWKNKPYEVKNTRKKYIRVWSSKREVSREEEIRLWQSSGNLKYDNIEIQESNIEEIDTKKVEKYIYKIYNKKLNETWIEYKILLQNLDICRKWIDDELYPTFAGLYFFWKSDIVRRRINSSFIICAYFKWNTMWSSEILDKKDIEWTFDEIYDDSIKFIHKYNAEYKKIKGYKSKIKYDYPLEAIRETLINAMLHRDYTYIWANIRIFMYEDRVEIISPWVLPNWLTLKALESWFYQRFTRNEYLINFASKFFNNIAESLWSWINRIKEVCKKWWYPEPNYLLTNNELRVTYYKNLSNIDEKPVDSSKNLSNKQKEVYKIIVNEKKVAMKDLERKLWTRKQTIAEHLRKLLDLWLIEKKWKWKNIVYYI